LAEAVHLACSCADVFVEEQAAEPITRVRQLCAQYHQMNERQTDEMLEAIGQQTAEVAPMFEIKIASGANYEAILKKANETLVELTLKSQQELNSLSEQNQKLQVAATTDRLTTLANRARFDEVFAQAVQTALANSRPLSLLMIDLDRFKSINDTHGHQVGDHILSSLGQLLRSAARASDLPARYGGEELVLVLPDTPRATAAAVAESVRRLIASRTVRCGNKQIPVTASIGVATLEPGGPLSAPAHLLKAADLAVYAAKHSGRNCVRVFSLKSAAA
jgi:diguanylate cyclase (GGDEF)-like protein